MLGTALNGPPARDGAWYGNTTPPGCSGWLVIKDRVCVPVQDPSLLMAQEAMLATVACSHLRHGQIDMQLTRPTTFVLRSELVPMTARAPPHHRVSDATVPLSEKRPQSEAPGSRLIPQRLRGSDSRSTPSSLRNVAGTQGSKDHRNECNSRCTKNACSIGACIDSNCSSRFVDQVCEAWGTEHFTYIWDRIGGGSDVPRNFLPHVALLCLFNGVSSWGSGLCGRGGLWGLTLGQAVRCAPLAPPLMPMRTGERSLRQHLVSVAYIITPGLPHESVIVSIVVGNSR
ncbi:uncharacterized protein BO97DRAFT_227992 [Aspergillus homomorphus CBS 101889]|uniref:Uncharacterized protein n=1 Tax=Aspergillus homomorphus (strain CBS 101889) TaxID=1450537 RepID=A0A395HJA3_ASPHC|nr:hypothetical protein BO97DRAFT_227992 [Aspergillus homomorphus CBS 101889]RAL08012.1 hypothetical protein BO97DRAFT_227992 [Aspergillus homomorphus CBS 101889]